jgi:hypothetical protein
MNAFYDLINPNINLYYCFYVNLIINYFDCVDIVVCEVVDNVTNLLLIFL